MRKILIILLCGTVTLLAGYVGLRAYKGWKQSHLLTLARELVAKKDVRSAVLAANQVLSSNPRNVEACRFMADLAEAGRSPEGVLWRSRVVELNPGSAEDRLALVRAALSLGDIISATNALAGVPESGRNTADYHNLAGAVAIATRQLPQAEAHLLQASQLQPTNPVPRLNLAMLRLVGTNAPARDEARNTLKQLSREPVVNCQAFRELISDALRNSWTNEAISLSHELVQQTNATFNDRLLQLQVLGVLRSEDFTPALARCRKEAESEPYKIYQLATWQLTAEGPQKVLPWLLVLPEEPRTNRAVQLVVAECRLNQQDWRQLQADLEPQNWGELEFLRHAFLARAMRGQELTSSAQTEWQLAVKSGNDWKQAQMMLLEMAARWNWRSEGEELLWNIVNRFPGEKWAWTLLQQALFAGGRTRSLMALYGEQLKKAPANLELKNNLVMTALLLNALELKPHELARELYEQASTNAVYASTYAFSLHLQEKDAEALKVMQQLTPKALEQPSLAGYYGLILKATGSNAQAQACLDRASQARLLLPEERQLFAQAKAGLGASGQ